MKKKKINPKMMIPWMLLPCFILLFRIQGQAKEIIVNDSGELRQVVETASDGDIIIIEGSPTVNDDKSDSAPWVINKAITIKGRNNNSEINLRAGGIILGNHVTFEDITLTFLNSTRNIIAANGYTLTLNNTTSSSFSQEMHLVCRTMYSQTDKVASADIPKAGNHGKNYCG